MEVPYMWALSIETSSPAMKLEVVLRHLENLCTPESRCTSVGVCACLLMHTPTLRHTLTNTAKHTFTHTQQHTHTHPHKHTHLQTDLQHGCDKFKPPIPSVLIYFMLLLTAQMDT
jgi:hypothetical protein